MIPRRLRAAAGRRTPRSEKLSPVPVRFRTFAASALLALLAPAAALADGAVFAGVGNVAVAGAGAGEAAEAAPTPSQRALIRWDAATQTETLVVETTVCGAGDDFAWVLPLPSAPTIEKSTTGLFSSLRPFGIVTAGVDVRPWWLATFALATVLAFIGRPRERRTVAGAVKCVLMLAAAGGAVVALAPTNYGRVQGRLDRYGTQDAAFDAAYAVEELDRDRIGVWETTVLAPKSPAELRSWLTENGYRAPDSIDAVVAEYIRDGWVFVAAKLRADPEASGGSGAGPDDRRTTHPLAFTFPTPEAVLPMGLTRALNDTVDLEIYVFGDAWAGAPGLETTHRWQLPNPGTGDPPVTCRTTHREILRRAGDAAHVSCIHGSLESSRRGALDGAPPPRDVELSWSVTRPDSERDGPRCFTHAAALTGGANLAALILVAGWFVVAQRREPTDVRRARVVVVLLATTALLGVWLSLPKLQGRRSSSFPVAAALQFDLSRMSPDSDRVTLRRTIEQGPFLRDAATARKWVREVVGRFPHPVSGRLRREEDSSGNYLIEDVGGVILFTPQGARGPTEWAAVNLSCFDRPSGPEDSVTLQGSVRDARGDPVVGAEIVIAAIPPAPSSAVLFAGERTTTTGADGAFRVEVPWGFRCDVTIDAPRHVVAIREGVDLCRPAPDPIDVVLEDAELLRGRVVGTDGLPIPDATVYVTARRKGEEYRETAVAPDGTFEIAAAGPTEAERSVTVHVHRTLIRCPTATFVLTPDAPCVDLRVELVQSDRK